MTMVPSTAALIAIASDSNLTPVKSNGFNEEEDKLERVEQLVSLLELVELCKPRTEFSL